jgi:hypothetical protein
VLGLLTILPVLSSWLLVAWSSLVLDLTDIDVKDLLLK